MERPALSFSEESKTDIFLGGLQQRHPSVPFSWVRASSVPWGNAREMAIFRALE